MCSMFPGDEKYPCPGDFIFTFHGKKERVDECMVIFEKERLKAEQLFKVSVPIIDPTTALKN
jgi:hypothetical protein